MEHQQDVVERRAELQVQTKKGSLSFRLSDGSTFLGSSGDADIALEDEVLEPRHLEFDWDGAELWLIYLGSGVRPAVGGELVSETRLYSGDQVEIGEISIRVRILRRRIAGRPAGRTPDAAVPGTAVPAGGEDTAETGVPQAGAEGAAEPAPPEEQVLLEYSVHQLTQNPRKSALVGGLLAVFLILLWFFVIPNNPTLLLVSIGVILASVSAFVFPMHYRLTEAGVEIRGVFIRDFKRWSRFQRYKAYPDAVQLLVSQRSIRGRIVKGTLIYFKDNRDEVMAIIENKIKPDNN